MGAFVPLRRNQSLAIWAIGDRRESFWHVKEFLPCLNIPHLHSQTALLPRSASACATGQLFAVRAEGDAYAIAFISVSLQCPQFVASLGIPHFHGIVGRSAGQTLAIRAKHSRVHPAGVLKS